MANYGRKATALLPRLEVSGVARPVVQVVDDKSGDIVYTLRIAGHSFQPPGFAPGRYRVRVSDPEAGRSKELTDLEASPENKTLLKVAV